VATYKEIQDEVKSTSGFTAQTCWIAHELADRGLTKRTAANRLNDVLRLKPCPPEKRAAIEAAIDKLP
jgi:hypothetical protein